jgi:hypothetical protein
MFVPAAFLSILLVYSTTPLAIKWSSEGAGFLFGVAGRMTLGTLMAVSLIRLLGLTLPWHREALLTYVAACLGMYGTMLSVFWGVQFIPSGWISVLFGLTPIASR